MDLHGLEPEEFKGLILSVGSHQGARPLSPIEVAEHFHKMKESGATNQHCADAMYLDGPSMVSRFLRLLKLAPTIQHNVDWGQSGATVGFTTAFELSKLPPSEQPELLRRLLEQGITSAEMKQVAQLHRRSDKSAIECIESIAKLRPEIETRHLVIGAISDSSLLEKLSGLTQAQRDEVFQEVLSALLPGNEPYEFRLGDNQFTVSGADEFYKIFSSMLGGDFENTISSELLKSLS